MKTTIRIQKSTRADLSHLTQKHFNTLLAPMDDMWENLIIPSGVYYQILDKKEIGYFIVDINKMLLQFYIEDTFQSEQNSIFKQLIKEQQILGAFAGTFEPQYLDLCLDHSSQTKVDTFLYKSIESPVITCPIKNLTTENASIENYEEVLEFCTEKVGLEGEWMQPYYQDLLPKNSVYLFRKDEEIIGAGELRPSNSTPKYANLGIMVSKDWRKRNVGSYIMNQMKLIASEKGLVGICSTTKENIASQKAIEKAGLKPYHKILKIDFK